MVLLNELTLEMSTLESLYGGQITVDNKTVVERT